MDTAQIITETRQNFQQHCRLCSPAQWPYNFLLPPRWMVSGRDRRFVAQYRDQCLLLRQGQIVWSHLVQANSQLFKPGHDNLPLNVVYSLDPSFDNNLSLLSGLAQYLFGLKHQSLTHPETAEIQIFAEAITHETQGLLNIEVPRHLSENRQVFFTSLVCHRKHLPGGHLQRGWFPLLTAPTHTRATLIVPGRYWASKLQETWLCSPKNN